MYIGEKDRTPLETIRLSTEYLQNRNIFFCEEWHNNGSSLFSVTLNIPGTAFTVNGKGINRELALASAHGELQERLLNKAFFRINTDTLYWMSNKDIASQSDLSILFSKIGLSCENSKMVQLKYEEAFGKIQKIEDDIFTSSKGERLVIPPQVTDYLYGTNGMCAGNTFEEACTQGLAEIIERYVAKQIFRKKMEIPNFDFECLDDAEYFRRLINRMGKMGLNVCIKDFSLGLNLPVVGVIFSNPQNHTYFMKMGAHPNLNIALERCFTEFAQGRTTEQLKKMVSCEEMFVNEGDRLLKYFVDGNVAFPISIIQNKGKSTIKSIKYLSNKEYYEYLLKCIEKLGFEVFFIDNSSDIFQAYRIIVPGMSEIADINEMPNVHSLCVVNKNIKCFFDNPNIKSENIDQLAELLDEINGLNKDIGLTYPIISVKMYNKRLPKFKMFELINLEYLMIGDFYGSFNFLTNHINLCEVDETYLCLIVMEKMLIEDKIDIKDKDFLMEALVRLFDEKICNTTYMILSKPNEIFEVECSIEDNYFFENRKELFKKIYE